jgi:hypothetical protein
VSSDSSFSSSEMGTDSRDPSGVAIPEGLDDWLVAFVHRAREQNAFLRTNGAYEAATARDALTRSLLEAAKLHLEEELDIAHAARLTHRSEEGLRRLLRSGAIPDRRESSKGHYRVQRKDLTTLVKKDKKKYNPTADAQDIAEQRRGAA